MIISSEDSATSPEVQDTTDEAIVPVPRVHSEFSDDTGVSAPVTATPGGTRLGRGMPTSRAANIAIAGSSVSTHMVKAMSTEMNPALSVRLECDVDAEMTETATVTLDETCVVRYQLRGSARITSAVDRAKQIRSDSSYKPFSAICEATTRLPRVRHVVLRIGEDRKVWRLRQLFVDITETSRMEDSDRCKRLPLVHYDKPRRVHWDE
ncbi:hypothetical protein PI125_g24845 [Phytophthora idaei]|nr:hypothetical protein PI125_g24845 [Phytophthora idaei]